jgi:hypothetical protein
MSENTRRAFGKLMLALPAVSLAVPAAGEDKPSDLPDLLAGREPGLSDDERQRLKKAIGDGLKPLQAVRDFKLPEDADPAFRFRAQRSARS